jgi:hypothetical protein
MVLTECAADLASRQQAMSRLVRLAMRGLLTWAWHAGIHGALLWYVPHTPEQYCRRGLSTSGHVHSTLFVTSKYLAY